MDFVHQSILLAANQPRLVSLGRFFISFGRVGLLTLEVGQVDRGGFTPGGWGGG